MEQNREFAFTDRQFDALRALAREHTGISLSDAKRDLVYGRLVRRLRALDLNGFDEYRNLLEQGDGGEIEQFSNAITTNLTSFFREPHHFEYLGDTVVPALVRRKARTRRLRAWSAGCSSGEEPYSIAMALRQSIPDPDSWDIKILATDLDSNMLDTGERGVYPEERVESLSQSQRRKWLRVGRGENSGKVLIAPELRDMVTFRKLNLMGPWPMRGPFDFIFCRNVVIYFDKETQKVLFDRFADLMEVERCLFIGHSESLFQVTDCFRLIGKTIYRKAA